MSSRNLTSGMAGAATDSIIRPIFFLECEFASGTLNLFTGTGTIIWDGKTWTGGTTMLEISPVQEVSELQAVSFDVKLSGNIPEVVSIALSQIRRGLPGRMWLALLTEAGTLYDAPFRCFVGRADKPTIVPHPTDAIVSLRYESRLVTAFRGKTRRYTSEDQHIDYPDDKGFDFVPALQDTSFTWGTR